MAGAWAGLAGEGGGKERGLAGVGCGVALGFLQSAWVVRDGWVTLGSLMTRKGGEGSGGSKIRR